MIKQLAHVCIGARDLDQTRDFYTRVLGLKIAFDFVKNGQCIGFYLQIGARDFIQVFHEGDADKKDGILRHICLETDDIQATVAKIRKAGADISDPQCAADHTWQAWTHDPSGVPIELFEYTPESKQFKGGTVEVTW